MRQARRLRHQRSSRQAARRQAAELPYAEACAESVGSSCPWRDFRNGFAAGVADANFLKLGHDRSPIETASAESSGTAGETRVSASRQSDCQATGSADGQSSPQDMATAAISYASADQIMGST